MKVQFNGPEDETTAFGVVFPVGTPVDIDDLEAEFQAKLQANPTFSVVEDGNREIDDLRAALSARGIPFHHKAGVAKLTALLAEANG